MIRLQVLLAVALVCPLAMGYSVASQQDDLKTTESKPEAYLVHLKPRSQQQYSPYAQSRKSKMLLLLRLPKQDQQETLLQQQQLPLQQGPLDIQQKDLSIDFQPQENTFQQSEQREEAFEEQREAGFQQQNEQRDAGFHQQQPNQQQSFDDDHVGFDDEARDTGLPIQPTLRPQIQTAIKNGFRPMTGSFGHHQEHHSQQVQKTSGKTTQLRSHSLPQSPVQSIAQTSFESDDVQVKTTAVADTGFQSAQREELPVVKGSVQRIPQQQQVDFGRKTSAQTPVRDAGYGPVQRDGVKSAPRLPSAFRPAQRDAVKSPIQSFARTQPQQIVQQQVIATTQRAPTKSAVKSPVSYVQRDAVKSPVQQRLQANDHSRKSIPLRTPSVAVRDSVKSTKQQRGQTLNFVQHQESPVKTAQRSQGYEAPIQRTVSKTAPANSHRSSPVKALRAPIKGRELPVQQHQEQQIQENFTTVRPLINEFQQQEESPDYPQQQEVQQQQQLDQQQIEKKVPVIMIGIPPHSSPFPQQKDTTYDLPLQEPLTQQRETAPQLPVALVKGHQAPVKRLPQLPSVQRDATKSSRQTVSRNSIKSPVQQEQLALPVVESYQAPVAQAQAEKTQQITQSLSDFSQQQENDFTMQLPVQQQQSQEEQEQTDFANEEVSREQKVALVIPTVRRNRPNLDIKGLNRPRQQSPIYEQLRSPLQQEEIKSPLQNFRPQEQQKTRDQSLKSAFPPLSFNQQFHQQSRPLPPSPALARPRLLFPDSHQTSADFAPQNQFQNQRDAYAATHNNPIFDDEEENFPGDEVGSYGLRNNAGFETSASSQQAPSSQQSPNGRMVLLLFDKGHVSPNGHLTINPSEGY